MEKVFCNDLQPDKKIRTTDKNGEIKDWKIVKMIPMQMCREGNLSEINDIEILLNKKKNIYFSYHMYLSGESWVRELEILN